MEKLIGKRIEIKKGERHNKLTLTGKESYYFTKGGTRVRTAECVCECGNVKYIALRNILRGMTKSCGCIQSVKTKKGDKYNRLMLTDIDYIEKCNKTGRNKRFVECICDCGNKSIYELYKLRSGNTKSCGCLKEESLEERNHKHGKSGTKIYHVWCAMKDRCLNQNNKRYHRYGGRGMYVCERWLDYELFLDDMLDSYKEGLTLDRIDNNKGYEPDNCRWITNLEQQWNKEGVTKLKYNGKLVSLQYFCDVHNISCSTTRYKIKNGYLTIKELEKMYATI